jgi:hypothetical protein
LSVLTAHRKVNFPALVVGGSVKVKASCVPSEFHEADPGPIEAPQPETEITWLGFDVPIAASKSTFPAWPEPGLTSVVGAFTDQTDGESSTGCGWLV